MKNRFFTFNNIEVTQIILLFIDKNELKIKFYF